MQGTAPTIPASQLQSRQERARFLRQENGDLRGSNFTIPKGDFAHFLGYKAPTEKELEGDTAGARAIEVALHQKINKLGKQAVHNGEAYRNMFISHGRYENKPGREKDLIADGLDSVRESLESGQEMGMRYLEMQYKFQQAGKTFGTISNLMKVRNEAVRKSMQDIR